MASSAYSTMKRDQSNADTVDLRSDTVTKPDEGMRKAMAEAKVGDDVYGEDPTVIELEAMAARILGKEASIFFPSGTQSNLAAILAHCGRGDELIAGENYHSIKSEAGGASVLGGIAMCPIKTETDGSLAPANVKAAIKPDDPHCPRTRLLCLENTVSGSAIFLDKLALSASAAREAGLSVHLDGARLFNAAESLEESPAALAGVADSVSACLSKGLGAPAGTVLAGSREFCAAARRNRKILGGSMRQSGVLAAAGIYALENNIAGLAEDRRRAKALSAAIARFPDEWGIAAEAATNMVFVTPKPCDHAPFRRFLEKRGILIGWQMPTMRIVVHRGIGDEDIERTADSMLEYFKMQSA
ncbi:MAG: low-specificity L-threonine aldolase [Albidovulum sp.]|nr:low-specificity L-threonine aldolase [Albidovulum sp.]